MKSTMSEPLPLLAKALGHAKYLIYISGTFRGHCLSTKPAAPKHEFYPPFQRDLGRPVCAAKNISLLISPKSASSSRHPASSKRGVRVVTIRGVRVAVDAMALRARGIAGRPQAWSWGCERSIRAGRAALLRTAKACGSGTRGWCQAGGG
jgi:hypothetical protein